MFGYVRPYKPEMKVPIIREILVNADKLSQLSVKKYTNAENNIMIIKMVNMPISEERKRLFHKFVHMLSLYLRIKIPPHLSV